MDALLHVALGRGTSEGIGSERIDRRLAIGSGGREEVVPTEETRTRRRYLSILLALGTSARFRAHTSMRLDDVSISDLTIDDGRRFV